MMKLPGHYLQIIFKKKIMLNKLSHTLSTQFYSLVVKEYRKGIACYADFYSLIFWYIINFCPVKFSCLNLISAFLIHDICWSLTMQEILIMTIEFRSIMRQQKCRNSCYFLIG